MVEAFLGARKTKSNGKTVSYIQLCKYHDAILFGAKEAKKQLPTVYYQEMEDFLVSFKKETTTARRDGNLDEQEADAITMSLFRLICEWAIEEQNVFIWVFSLLQWHCMARLINIGVLALHCFCLGEDNLIVRYDHTKADQTGEKLEDKHLFDNPFDPSLSLFTSMGVYFCLEAARFEDTEFLFQHKTNEDSASSQRYCMQLSEMFRRHEEALAQYIRVDHANSHGLRKGSTTYASAGTTSPASISAIASRGEWSMTKILNLYIQFCAPGDTYLGRILAFLDPNTPEFAALPPHWNVSIPMENHHVRHAMNLTFAPILQRWQGTNIDPTGMLLRCLASMVWHADFLRLQASSQPGHPFLGIIILQDDDLMVDLKSLVTIQPVGQMLTPTGIPPHVSNAMLMKEVLQTCKNTLEAVQQMATGLDQQVKDAVKNAAIESWHITPQQISNQLSTFRDQTLVLIRQEIQAIANTGALVLNNQAEDDSDEDDDDINGMPFLDGSTEEEGEDAAATLRIYCWGGQYWHVPESFAFPEETRLNNAFNLWCNGMDGFLVKKADGTFSRAPI